ncbi:MAG: DUF2207 domain-containing protein [Ardenticatenaceae bacterium]|nr:DUF2207 domain-containing protein [Ardenticatenaceae bacterium]MCB9443807.1 DUF2207 domain-containing protein [Ardenticatenaceae bacterium]
MFKRSGWMALILVAALFVLTGTVYAQKSYSADRFDVDVTVQNDGSLLVTETVVFDFVGGPFTYVFRELPNDHTDGITNIIGSVDGDDGFRRTLSQGDQTGQLEISGGSPIRVTWHLEPTSNTTRTFVLSYHVLGVVRQAEGSDLLLWQALPDEYEYTIAHSTTTINYPAGLELVGQPEVQAGQPTVSRDGNQVRFTSQNLQPNSPLVVGLRFPAGSILTAPPEWQARQETQSAQTPIWIGVSAAILAAGLTVLFTRIMRYRPRATTRPGVVYEPPSKLAPGIAGTLLTYDANPTWANALGTLFSLAEQGVLEIDESPEQKWYRKHDFLIRLLEEPAQPLPHEEALLDLLFTTKKGPAKTVKFSDLSDVVTSRRWKTFTETGRMELKLADWFSPERNRARKSIVFSGILLLAVGFAAMILLGVTGSLGLAPLAVGGSLGLLGIITAIASTAISPLTDEAATRKAEWEQFADYLKEVTKGKAAVDNPNLFFKYLPYAAAFGLLPQWTRYFEKEGWTEVPPYFHALPNSDPAQSMAAFGAMSAASSTAGGAAAGAAGAGAAGGGASGAG